MTVDQKVATRLAELIAAGDRVLATRRHPASGVIAPDFVDSEAATQWATSAKSLLVRAFGAESVHASDFAKFTSKHIGFHEAGRAQAVLRSAAEDLAGGHIFDVRRLVEAELLDGFLEQSAALLEAGYDLAAAVVAGAVLEDALRTLCTRNSIALAAKPKLDQMNSDLAKAGAYTKLTLKRVTLLADVRNNAAHGRSGAFTKKDVEELIDSVRRFVEEFVS